MLDLSDRLVSLRDASIQSDHEGLQTAAHAMAGMAAEYGMASLEARLRTLMQTACQEPMALSPCVDEAGGRTLPALSRRCDRPLAPSWSDPSAVVNRMARPWRHVVTTLDRRSLGRHGAGERSFRQCAPRALGFGAIVTVRRCSQRRLASRRRSVTCPSRVLPRGSLLDLSVAVGNSEP